MTLGSALVSSSQAGRRLAAAADWLRGTATATRALVVGPGRGSVDDFLRQFCVEAGGRLGIERTTLYLLALELAGPRLAAAGAAPLTGLGADALATRAVFAALREAELDYFRPVAALPGFPRALRRTLEELRLERLESEVLAGAGPGGPDLALLLERYQAELERWGLADRAKIFAEATAAVLSGAAPAGLPMLWLDVPLTCELERGLLDALRRSAAGVFATVAAGDERSRRLLESVLELDTRDLDGSTDPEAPLERVQRYVFEPEIPPASVAVEARGGVDFFAAPGEGQECVEIVRRARDLAARGIPFDRMAVFLRQPTLYIPLLEDALRRASIPAYFTRGTARPDAGGRAFLALLACAGEELSASRFAEYLSLGQVPILDPSGAPPAREVPWVEPEGDQFVLKSVEAAAAEPTPEDPSSAAVGGSLSVPAQWERLLVDAAVVGGSERWERRLRGLERELELRLREVADEESNRRLYLERQLERLSHLERFALPLIHSLAELPTAARWGEWIGILEELAARSLRRPETVLQLLAELRPMEDVGPVDLEHVRAVLHERLIFLRSEPPRRRYGRLFVATVEEAQGRSFDVVFLPGLAEGIFPRGAYEDPLLLDEWRRRMAEGLPCQEDRLLDERLLLRLAVGSAGERLVLSYPSLDLAVGRPRVPSFYALDILRAAEGELPALDDLAKRASETGPPRLGWPAPRTGDEAIDDAEYDLALLQPLLRASGAALRGQGRFLLQCNPHLERSLRARWWRWHRPWTEHDGLVVEEGDQREQTLAALARQRLAARSYSPTALQHFAACPYRFFLQAILRLRPREELSTFEQLDPLTRGSLFHETQFVLFGELEAAGLLPLRSDSLGRILDLVDDVLDRIAGRYAEELAPAIPRVWMGEIESLRNDLRGWIVKVLEEQEIWSPLHSELAFGLRGPAAQDRDPASREDPVEVFDGYLLRGSIDLVEQDREGSRLRVTDHKTGRAIRERVVAVGGGRILQPLLYGLATEQILAHDGERAVESGRLFFCTQRGGYETTEVRLDDANREAVRAVLETIDGAVAEGFLPAAPDEGDCRYCDYRPVCGPYEELRIQRKRQDRLVDLQRLRERR